MAQVNLFCKDSVFPTQKPTRAQSKGMKNQLIDCASRKLSPTCAAWSSILSIGDGAVETAAREVGRAGQEQSFIKRTKTVKLIENPSVSELTHQLKMLASRLPSLLAASEDLH